MSSEQRAAETVDHRLRCQDGGRHADGFEDLKGDHGPAFRRFFLALAG